MQIVVYNRAEVQIARNYGLHAFISIKDTDQADAPLPENPLCVDVLRLAFDDVLDGADQGREIVCFSDEQAGQILNFWHTVKDKIDTLIIHCNGGQCRSPGVAAALEKIEYGDDTHWFRTKRPNIHVYRTLLEVDYLRNNP